MKKFPALTIVDTKSCNKTHNLGVSVGTKPFSMNFEIADHAARHSAAVASDRQKDQIFSKLKDSADALEIYKKQSPFLEPQEEQDCLGKILSKILDFCDFFTSIFPLYKHAFEETMEGERMRRLENKLKFITLKNFQAYAVALVRSLRPFFLGCKVMSVMFEIPSEEFNRELNNFR